MKKFYNFLESVKSHDPRLIEGIRAAYDLIFEGLSTDEALDSADMALEQNTEEKIAENAPIITPEDTADMSDQDISLDDDEMDVPEASDEISEDDISIDGLDELIPE